MPGWHSHPLGGHRPAPWHPDCLGNPPGEVCRRDIRPGWGRRIGGAAARIARDVAPEDRLRIGRCMGLFKDFCVVTQSVRGGIPVDVSVEVPRAR